MTENDINQINYIFDIDDSFKMQWICSKQYLVDDRHRKYAFVAEYDDELAGFIYGDMAFETLLIPQLLYVKPNLRNKGIGSQLMNTIEKESKCQTSLIYYHNHLHDYYAKIGYEQGANLEVAIKTFTSNFEENK
jgi:predicted N-acetyltransferase YhbS